MTAVTIAMPVYNGADYLDAALAALSKQTFSDMKIIISDNASTDSTPEIIAAWAARDKRIIPHRQSENIGSLPNFNWVLNAADSPWVMFACHDDLWSPNYVGEMYKCVMSRSGTQLAVAKMHLIRPDGSENPKLFYEPINQAEGLRRKILSLLRVNSGWYYGLYERQALLTAWKNSKRFKYTWAADFIVLLPFLVAGTIVGSNAAVYYKRETPLSEARYKPKTLPEQFLFYRSFLRESWRIVQESSLSFGERLVFAPLIVLYTDRCAWKLRRLVRSAVFKLLQIG